MKAAEDGVRNQAFSAASRPWSGKCSSWYRDAKGRDTFLTVMYAVISDGLAHEQITTRFGTEMHGILRKTPAH